MSDRREAVNKTRAKILTEEGFRNCSERRRLKDLTTEEEVIIPPGKTLTSLMWKLRKLAETINDRIDRAR